MGKILAIYDFDVVYATRLMEFFTRSKNFNYEVSIFTRRDTLEDYITNKKIEILLLSGNIAPEEVLHDNIKLIYLLSETANPRKDTAFPSICKYQSAQTILSEISTYYASSEREVDAGAFTDLTKIISIFSPNLSLNKSSFAWSFASILAEKKKTLLINLELYPILSKSLCDTEEQDLSELIYYLKQDNPNIMNKMKSLLRYTGKLAILPTATHGFDLLSLNQEDMSKWMEALGALTDYEIVVFYLDFYSEATTEIIAKSNSVYLPITDNAYDDAVLKDWERQAKLSGLKVEGDKFQKVYLPRDEWTEKKNVTLQELKSSSIWNLAGQYIEKLML